jgi:signal transduction histidine kinase/CheY-like chemotaxis protein
MLSEIKSKKSLIFQLVSMSFLLAVIAFLLLTFNELRQGKSAYIHSKNVLTVNNELDHLFKDFVYDPLVVEFKNRENYEQEKGGEINQKITFLKKMISNDPPNSSHIQEIQNIWNLLKNASDAEKLNLLYDLELLHNMIDVEEQKSMNGHLTTVAGNLNLLIAMSLLFILTIFVTVYFSKYYAEKELKDSQFLLNKVQKESHSMSAFLAVAAHELRTPLAGIIGLADVLRNSFLPENETHYADNIYHTGKTLLKMTNNILEFANIETSKIELVSAEFSLGILIQQIVISYSTEANEKNINFSYKIDEDVPLNVYGDSSRLSQVLYHFVGNAVRSTINGSITLKIKVISKNPSIGILLFFSVEDSGIGISEEEINKLFLPFSGLQYSGNIGENYPVLCFSFCAQLVKAMGGECEVTSKEGVGSVFSFSAAFPKYSEEKLNIDYFQKYHFLDDHVPMTPLFDKENKPLILVVDDDPANLLMAQVMLERLGAKTIKATNGKEAVNEFAKRKVDLILMDCQMPVMDGCEATKAIRQKNGKVPVLAMAATLTAEDRSQCLKAGMNGFVTKPIEIENLVGELSRALQFDPGTFSVEILENLEKRMGHLGMARVVQSFLDDLAMTEESIDQSLRNNDLENIHNICNHIKYSSQLVGAKGMNHLFTELEKTQNMSSVYELKRQIDLGAIQLKSKFSERLNNLQ